MDIVKVLNEYANKCDNYQQEELTIMRYAENHIVELNAKVAELQAQLDAIYALKPAAYIDVSIQCIRPACLITFHTPTVANIPDIELVVLPPREEV